MILVKDKVEKEIKAPKVIDRLKKEGWEEKGEKKKPKEKGE